jgi:hypothetical protein
LEEEHTTLLVADRSTVRQLGSGTKSIQDWLFVVVTGNALFFAEDTGPFIFTLFVDTVEAFVKNRFDNTTKVGTAHWSGHFLVPLK